jgi:hypothetical protein
MGALLENRWMAKAVMIPRGTGLLRKPLYVWVASLALKVLIGVAQSIPKVCVGEECSSKSKLASVDMNIGLRRYNRHGLWR